MENELHNNCGKKEVLITYLYNETNVAERASFEQHLTSCSHCRAELQAFQGVREEMSLWEMPVVPRIEVVTPRSAMDALREFFNLVPGWFKLTSGLATAAAAVLVLFALSGTRISFGTGGVDARFGVREITQSTTDQPVNKAAAPATVKTISRAEAEQMIQTAVTQVQARAQEETRQQLASLEARLNSAHQTELQNATMRLRKEHQQIMRAELAKFDYGQRQTLTEWLFAASDQGGATPGGSSNERNQ